jgi:hypothetical protein
MYFLFNSEEKEILFLEKLVSKGEHNAERTFNEGSEQENQPIEL